MEPQIKRGERRVGSSSSCATFYGVEEFSISPPPPPLFNPLLLLPPEETSIEFRLGVGGRKRIEEGWKHLFPSSTFWLFLPLSIHRVRSKASTSSFLSFSSLIIRGKVLSSARCTHKKTRGGVENGGMVALIFAASFIVRRSDECCTTHTILSRIIKANICGGDKTAQKKGALPRRLGITCCFPNTGTKIHSAVRYLLLRKCGKHKSGRRDKMNKKVDFPACVKTVEEVVQ